MRNVVVLLLLILVKTRHASKKSVMAALRDTIELSNSENPGSVTGSTLTQAQKDSVLQLHNAFRSMVKPAASNMLRMMWDDDLEKISSDFANKCIVAHNPDRHKLAKNYDWVGENIAWGTGTCGDKECGDVFEGVKRWFSESKSYTYLTGQCSGKCTLYTQMVWWESNKLGCGAKRCGDRTILVCNYAPGGNYVGQRPYKTGKVCSECPTGLVCEDNLCTEPKKTTELATALDTTTAKEVPKKEPPTATATGESECPGGVAKKEDLSTGVPVLICPPLIAQIANALNTPTEPPSVAEDHTLPAGWTELPMRLTQVDSGITPAIWGINGKHELYSLNTNNALKKIDGTMHHVSAGQAGVWAVGLLGNVFYRKGEAGDSDDVNAREGVPPLWEKIPGNLKQIDSGTTGVVWGVNRFNRIFCRIGVDKSRPEGTGWMRIEGSMKYVSCGEYGCWAVNKRDNVYFRVGITEALPQGTQWTVVPGRLRMVESGPAGLTVGLSDTSDLFVRQGVTPQKPEGVKWVKLNLKLAHVTVGDKGIIGILSDGTVAVHRDINSFIYQTPTIAPTDSGLLPSRASPLEAVTAIKPTTAAVVNESPVTLQTLEGSLETLQQLNPSPPQTGSLTEKDQLHISPDMAAKILKLIEQKGNQFEDAHKAAAAAAALSRNGTIGTLNALSQKSDETPLAPPSEADVQLKNTSSLEGTPKPFSPPLPGPAPEAPATPEPSETKATSQDQEEKAHAAGEPADQKEDTTPSPSDALISPTEPPAVPVAVATTTKAAPTTVKPSPVETQPPTTRLKTSRRLTTQPKTTNKPSTPAAAAIAAYPQPKLPTHRPPTTRPRTTSSLLTKTHSNWVHRVATTTPAPAVQPPAAAVNPPAVLPPPSATAAVPTTLPPPVPLGQRIVAHSGQIVPTTQPPTAINAALKHTYAAPHAALNVPTPVMFHGKKPAAAGGKINVHKVVMLGGLHLSQQPQPLLHQAAVPLQMTRSCCAIPDSVCPIPKDCVGYIECHGYHGNYKSCDRGKMFNPITNICDYPRNVDCESVKASSINGASSTTTTTPVTPLLTTTTNAILSNATNNATTSTTPSTTTVGKESTTTVASVIAGNQAPQLAALQHAPGAQRDETSKLDAKQTSVQPRVKRPHTDDDGVLREVWFGLGLSPLLTLLTNNPRFPTNPDEYIVLDKFEAPPNAGDGYGQRLSTYYKAPETGEYIFYMSCDNECELWISPDTEEIHSNLILELKHGHFTSFRQWHKYPSEQTSRPIYLQEGEYYFIESFMKEGAGGDDLSIGVKLPGGEFDLPISKNLYLVPGDASTGSLTRKVGQSVLLPQSEETVLKLPPPVQQQQQQTQQQQTQQQQTQQQLQQTQQVTSTSQGASLVSSPTLQQSYSQPVPVAQTVSVMSPEEAATMGPQPGQTAEQWLAANKAPVSTMSLAKYKQQAGIVPGAEMYSHNNDGELEAFEQQTSQHYRSSVKRNSIGRANHSAIR